MEITIPCEIWYHIASFLDVLTFRNFRQSCKTFQLLHTRNEIVKKYTPAIVKIQRYWRKHFFGEGCQLAKDIAIKKAREGSRYFRLFCVLMLTETFRIAKYNNSREEHILLQQGDSYNSKKYNNDCEKNYYICQLCLTEKIPCIDRNFYCSACITKSKKLRRKINRIMLPIVTKP